jgi:hypothetical protein
MAASGCKIEHAEGAARPHPQLTCPAPNPLLGHDQHRTTMSEDRVLDSLRERFARIDERFDAIDRKLDEIGTRVSSLQYHCAGFQRGTAAINVRLDNLDRRVTRSSGGSI